MNRRAFLLRGFACASALAVTAPAIAAAKLDVLYSFTANDSDYIGSNPALVQGADGNLYGTTILGGAYNHGSVYKISPSGAFTTLYSFSGATDGGQPYGGLTLGSDGNFYGTTTVGNATSSGGTIFKMTPNGGLTTLYSFCSVSNGAGGCADGAVPSAPLLQAADGNFYGTTAIGGTYSGEVSYGTIFKMTPQGVLTTLHLFTSYHPSGLAGTTAGLVQGSDGTLYGTVAAGSQDNGSVFTITTSGVFKTLHNFSGTDGSNPLSTLVKAPDGSFYGTTQAGGIGFVAGSNSHPGYGSVFRITPAGAFSTLYSFTGNRSADGSGPIGITLAGDGNLYGVTLGGDSAFKLTPTGVFTNLLYFTSGVFSPGCALLEGADHKFYGTAALLGAHGYGGIFSLSVISAGNALGTQTDYLGEGKADFAVWRPSTGYWYSIDGAGGSATGQWGAPADLPVIGDFDGDGKSDFAVFRPATGFWYIKRSSDQQIVSQQWGAATDIPVAGDFDGDGKTDFAVFRPATGYWYVIQSSSNAVLSKQFGEDGDIPVVGDFDGDGKSDVAVYRPTNGFWYITQSSNNAVVAEQWGAATDTPVTGDFDGDGRTDIAVYRPSTGYWYIIQSSNGQVVSKQWGQSGDVPVARDYDGDGKTDIAVWRPSTGYWYVIESTTGQTQAQQWGAATDIPVNSLTR